MQTLNSSAINTRGCHALMCNPQKAQQILLSARMQLVSSKTNLFTTCMQLASDPINLTSNSRVTRV